MDPNTVALKLLALSKEKRDAIVMAAIDDYFKVLYTIASDIYDSCIEDFYYKYTPRVYDRHGNIAGENLYKANMISYEGYDLRVLIDANQLAEYKLPKGQDGNGEGKREHVLSSVMRGLRGGPFREGWPKQWRTSYPNQFSTAGDLWSSSKRTLNGIFVDFIDNVMTDTEEILWTIISQKL